MSSPTETITIIFMLPYKGNIALKVKSDTIIRDAVKAFGWFAEGLEYYYKKQKINESMPFSFYRMQDGDKIMAHRIDMKIKNFTVKRPVVLQSRTMNLYNEFMRQHDMIQSKKENRSSYMQYAQSILDKHDNTPNKILQNTQRKTETKYVKPKVPCCEELPKFW